VVDGRVDTGDVMVVVVVEDTREDVVESVLSVVKVVVELMGKRPQLTGSAVNEMENRKIRNFLIGVLFHHPWD
jgi:hypothetical protein